MAEYERRHPEQTLLHQVVREQLETFLARAQCRDQSPPRFVERELRAFLRCGVHALGFLSSLLLTLMRVAGDHE